MATSTHSRPRQVTSQSSRRISFAELEARKDLVGGILEVYGCIPGINGCGEVIRLDIQSLIFFSTPQVFLAIRFSHAFKPENLYPRWWAVDIKLGGYYYPVGYYEFCFGPVLNANGSISFFCPNSTHFVTFFPKGIPIPSQPVDTFQRQLMWTMLRLEWLGVAD